MAKPAVVNVKVNVQLDVSAARRQVRRMQTVAREVAQELARLDEALAQMEGREAALAHYGIQLVEVPTS